MNKHLLTGLLACVFGVSLLAGCASNKEPSFEEQLMKQEMMEKEAMMKDDKMMKDDEMMKEDKMAK